MLRCWKILIPLRLVDGYDHAVASLKKMGMQPEATYHHQQQSSAGNNGVQGSLQMFQFQPPW
jgi:hypothetical protein